MNRRISLGLLVIALAVAACAGPPPAASPGPTAAASPSSRPTPTPQPTGTTPTAGLAGRQFVSIGVTRGGQPFELVPGTDIRLDFEQGQMSARAGCNTMGGTYALDGDTLVVSGGAMTEIGCDPGRHAQDDWLFGFLGSSPMVELDGNQLTLTVDDTVVTLRDREVVEPDQGLVGTTWRLASIISGDTVSSIPDSVRATVLFGEDGRMSIEPGCNSGSASYEVADGATLTVGEITLTRMACDGPAGQIETAVLDVIGSETMRLSIDSSTLTLESDAGGLVFAAD